MDKEVELAEEEKLSIDKPLINAATYSFKGEDHTLGNLLRSFLIKDHSVSFSGYSVPHPSEDIMNVRVQTYNKNTCEVVDSNLNTIIDVCNVINSKFDHSLTVFNKSNKNK